MEQKKETRGRHKKNCTCKKCLLKYPERLDLLTEKTEEPKKEIIPEVKAEIPEIAKNANPVTENITVRDFDNMGSMLNEYNNTQSKEDENISEYNQQIETPKEQKYIIKGRMLLFLIDAVIPEGIVFLYNKIRKKNIKAKDIRLDEDEKKELESLADEVAQTIGGATNPLTALIVSMALIYTMNIIAAE